MENNQRNSRKRLNSLILLVAFTAVMLIVSTYAWFSAQKNVTLGGLKGKVSVAEGLEISLDAKYWGQDVDFSKYSATELKRLYGSAGGTLKDNDMSGSETEHNIVPSELVPVSTTGLDKTTLGTTAGDGIGELDMKMYRGINVNGNDLYEIIKVFNDTTSNTAYNDGGAAAVAGPGHHDFSGYYAIDFFLRNSTSGVAKTTQADGVSDFGTDVNALQLNSNSRLELQSASAVSTGLQNTVRVAFALYNINEEKAAGLSEDDIEDGYGWNDYIYGNTAAGITALTRSAYMTATQTQILNAYTNQTINDVAIWEPNASDHSQYVVSNNNNVTFNGTTGEAPNLTAVGDILTYGIGTGTGETLGKFTTSDPLPTYALSNASLSLAMADGPDTDSTAGDSDTDINTVKVGAGSTFKVGITDIYDWKTPYSSLKKQVTLQTEKQADSYTVGKVKQLISVTSTAANRYTVGTESGASAFSIPKGKVCKLRMYVWLEGQDVDTINQASHGGGIVLDVGLLKDGTAES